MYNMCMDIWKLVDLNCVVIAEINKFVERNLRTITILFTVFICNIVLHQSSPLLFLTYEVCVEDSGFSISQYR